MRKTKNAPHSPLSLWERAGVRARHDAAAEPKFIAEHRLTTDKTLSHLSFQAAPKPSGNGLLGALLGGLFSGQQQSQDSGIDADDLIRLAGVFIQSQQGGDQSVLDSLVNTVMSGSPHSEQSGKLASSTLMQRIAG